MQTNNKNILPTDNFLEEDKTFEKELENFLELPAEMENIKQSKKIEKERITSIFNPEKAAIRKNRRNKRKFDSHVTNLEKKQNSIKKIAKGKEQTNLQKLLDKSMELPANMPQFLGKKHSRQSAA